MISNEVKQLVQDIFLQINNPMAHDEVKEDPEAHLISLLMEIKEDISGYRKYRVPLHSTVERASCAITMKRIRTKGTVHTLLIPRFTNF